MKPVSATVEINFLDLQFSRHLSQQLTEQSGSLNRSPAFLVFLLKGRRKGRESAERASFFIIDKLYRYIPKTAIDTQTGAIRGPPEFLPDPESPLVSC